MVRPGDLAPAARLVPVTSHTPFLLVFRISITRSKPFSFHYTKLMGNNGKQ
jgi:hypothetical protein